MRIATWVKTVFVVFVVPVVTDAVGKWIVPDTYGQAKMAVIQALTPAIDWLSQRSSLTNWKALAFVLVAYLLGCAFVGAVWFVKSRRLQRASSTEDSEPAPKPEKPVFEPDILQGKILHLFWGLNANQRLSNKSISEHTTHPSNEVEHALDGLCESELVSDSRDPLTGRSFYLNEKGRKFYSASWGHPAAIGNIPRPDTPPLNPIL